jgi:hypothetical protein
MNMGVAILFETIWSYNVDIIDLWNIFQWKNKSKLKIVLEFGDIIGVVGKPLASQIK